MSRRKPPVGRIGQRALRLLFRSRVAGRNYAWPGCYETGIQCVTYPRAERRQRGEGRLSRAVFRSCLRLRRTQLSHFLLHHLTPLGAVQTCLLLMAVWWEPMTQSGHSAPHRQGIIPPIERGEFGPRRRHPLPPLPRRAWWNPRGYRRWRTHQDGWSQVAKQDGR